MNKTVMMIGAHSDDVELQAGGTLAKYMAEGYKGVYIIATDNSAGIVLDETGRYKRYLLPEESCLLRRKEAEKAAAVFGLKPVFLDFKERFCSDLEGNLHYVGTEQYAKLSRPESRECILIAHEMQKNVDMLADIIRKEQPEAIFTHTLDSDPEHRSVCSLVFKACREAAKDIRLGRLYGWGPSSGGEIIHIKPDMIIDISPYFNKKMEAFYCFECQVGERLKSVILQRAKTWGEKIGVEYAEAFIKILPAEENEYTE